MTSGGDGPAGEPMREPALTPALVGDELADAIENLLEVHPAGEDAPWLGFLDGALAGFLLSPAPIPPEEWLREVQAGPDVRFPDPADGERFAALLRMRQAEMAALMIEGGLAFIPLYDGDEDGEPIWQIWLAGFLSAMAPRMEAWQSFLDSEDEDLAAAIMGLMSLSATLPGLAGQLGESEVLDGDLLDAGDEMAEQASMMLPYFVETIYRRRHGLERVVMDEGFVDGDWGEEGLPQQPVRVQKVGRNEPCPCGSGKKFKKCCSG